MKITCISDLHGELPTLPGGDLLIICGDITAQDKVKQWYDFYEWLKVQNYEKKILVGGNHDVFLESCIPTSLQEQLSKECGEDVTDKSHVYLRDSGTVYRGWNIWGTPWTKKFEGMNHECTAFTKRSEIDLSEKFALIPDDTDILITHGPPFGILDKSHNEFRCGSHALSNRIEELKNLKIHCFGHIHEAYGKQISDDLKVLNINCSIMDWRYNPTNKPVEIEL